VAKEIWSLDDNPEQALHTEFYEDHFIRSEVVCDLHQLSGKTVTGRMHSARN
jgi:hypothetical protein